MVPLLAREKLIAQSVARCHTRGFLSADACLQTHLVCNEEGRRLQTPIFSAQQQAAWCCLSLSLPRETCFSLMCRVSSPFWMVNVVLETPDIQGHTVCVLGANPSSPVPKSSTALRTLSHSYQAMQNLQLKNQALLQPGPVSEAVMEPPRSCTHLPKPRPTSLTQKPRKWRNVKGPDTHRKEAEDIGLCLKKSISRATNSNSSPT